MPEVHCVQMKKIAPELIELNYEEYGPEEIERHKSLV